MSDLKIAFAGTPDFAATSLNKLIASTYKPCVVYTQPDRPAGRGKKFVASPVKQLAMEHGIAVEQPLNFKENDTVQRLASYQPDLMVVIAYGLLLPESVLAVPRLGCINVHASLLPRWRGAAPIQRAIEAGDNETGVAIMQMDKGLDTGPVWHEAKIIIEPNETGGSLHDKLAELGATSLLEALPAIVEPTMRPAIQSDMGVTYAHKLSKSDGLLDWHSSAAELDAKIRAFNPWPVAYFKRGDQAIRVWQAKPIEKQHGRPAGELIAVEKDHLLVACGENALALHQLQVPGSRAMAVRDLLNSKADWFSVGQLIGHC